MQFNLIQFTYERKAQPEQYGSETVSIGGSAIVEEGEDAFAIADNMIGRAKAVAYSRLGLKATAQCGAADLASVKVTAVPSAEKQAAAPKVDLADPAMTNDEIKDQVAAEFGQPARRKRRTKAEMEAARAAEAAGGDTEPLSAVEQKLADVPVEPESDEDAMMAVLNQGGATAAPAPAEDDEIDNPTLMKACATAAQAKRGQLVLDFLKKVGVDRVLQLDQGQRKSLLAHLSK